MSTEFDQLEALRRHAEQSPYPFEAFMFVLKGLVFAREHVQYDPQPPYQRGGHLDAVDICWCLHDYALVLFDERARGQLHEWHVERTEDFGRILCGLIECGLAAKLDEDSPDDFIGVFDFDQEFRGPDDQTILEPATIPPEARRRRFQFSLRWLGLAMLVIAGGFGWFGALWQRAEKQRIAVSEIRRSGGRVMYDNVNGPDLPIWQRLFGIDFANDVRAVIFEQSSLTRENIAAVTRLSNVNWLTLSQVDDPSVIRQFIRLPKLHTVVLFEASDELLENLSVGAPQLERLDLIQTPLSETGLAAVAHMTQLQRLAIDSDSANDKGLSHLRNLRSLKELRVHSTNVRGDCLRDLSSLTGLEKLNLSRTALRSDFVGDLIVLKSLKELNLSGSKVDDSGLVSLSQMTQLERLILSDTQITEAGMVHLKKMNHLRRLEITCPQLSTQFVRTLQAALPRTRVHDDRVFIEEMRKIWERYRATAERERPT